MASSSSSWCTFVDCCGLAVTCSSQKALTLYNQALEATISWRTNCLPDLYSALEEDNGLVLAHCLVVSKQMRTCTQQPLCNGVCKLQCCGVCCRLLHGWHSLDHHLILKVKTQIKVHNNYRGFNIDHLQWMWLWYVAVAMLVYTNVLWWLRETFSHCCAWMYAASYSDMACILWLYMCVCCKYTNFVGIATCVHVRALQRCEKCFLNHWHFVYTNMANTTQMYPESERNIRSCKWSILFILL